ncbi:MULTISPECIES: glycosyltransferase [Bacteria]|uniref:GalNac(5)-diNacbac-PP-undecaprenol beta-1,3-glucosyltransferase n=7 Tax=Enterobacteriaceae TaxID=543 RepID=A0A510B203_SHIDY|nr:MULTISPECIES: glycosyltransferase [Bacteria]AXC25072.1 galNac(5)-diNacbac-PP-undecaprenol beta-1,3-glucosyltransferase [Shigella dysenteriae]EFJ2541190.1 glycosyltransferase [Escherichia coli]EFY9856770.1 glycosyltransferase [Shigella dysenteriae]EGI3177034.1 glycosyltransferase [Escherichia coli]EHR8767078.1 glycosyltransferase [Escherichia coli]
MSCDENDKVSIYISTYNRVNKLKRAIFSVLNQDYTNIEIIVCDDASNDGTEEFMNDLVKFDNRVLYIRNTSNLGACATRNNAINVATGKFITGLDDDDEFMADRVSVFVKYWDDNYAFICSDFIEKFDNGLRKNHYHNKKLISDYTGLLYYNNASNQIFTLTKNLRSINGFRENVKRYQDWDTWLRLSYKFGEFLRIPNATYIMNHDHSHAEPRVSTGCSSIQAIKDHRDRNLDIYQGKQLDFLNFLILQLEGKESILECIKWSYEQRNIKYFIKYFFSKNKNY